MDNNKDLKLVELHAAGNNFGPDGFEALIKILDQMNSLEVVNFSRCIKSDQKQPNGLHFLC